MSTVLLVRHGLTAMTGPVLAGRTPGVHLDERGQRQAAALAERVAALPLRAIVTSPLERCVDTAEAIRTAQLAADRTPDWAVDDRLIEAGYGDWTGCTDPVPVTRPAPRRAGACSAPGSWTGD